MGFSILALAFLALFIDFSVVLIGFHGFARFGLGVVVACDFVLVLALVFVVLAPRRRFFDCFNRYESIFDIVLHD